MRWPTRRPSVAIVSNEFFDRDVGRMGGFGWAARATAEFLAERPELGLRPVLLAGQGELREDVAKRSNGVPLVRYERRRRYVRALRGAHPSLALTIDYRPNYRPVLEALPDVPVMVWVRDPRTPEDHAKIATLSMPSSAEAPAGVGAIDCTSLAPLLESVAARGTRVVVAATAPALVEEKSAGAYGLTVEHVPLLPNPLDPASEEPQSSAPRVAFLGRLDPIKRPWVFVELARRFPRVEFLVLGQSHFSGGGAWKPAGLPENVRLLGHVDRAEKSRLLASSWLLVNTSIHEGLAISLLEALHHATPIVSCQDPERVTSRFGLYVGRWDGNGLDALDAFADALEQLLEDHELRFRLGQDGRSWVRATHTRDRFGAAFAKLATG